MEMELKPLDSTDRSTTPKDERSLLKSDSTTSSSSASSASYTAINSENLLELEKKCAAYVRKDVYGPMGRGVLPLQEKILLGLSMVTLVPIRLVSGILNETMQQSDEVERPGAIVSNHVSYVDILYHMSSSFPSFVAKVALI
ncbi:lysophospholipid acyltransferase LPEAT1-like protein [Carex littledalei]|uniref:Lysophospholipid acyltransferase LPEAT1-like protein n=1 Tax=Carex littledalei TaxID=544730 RepID=A0A833REZ7_9POAL|nr:lysophospholipid acyltransferase LPEAT1-like protein [Carex littledalei]